MLILCSVMYNSLKLSEVKLWKQWEGLGEGKMGLWRNTHRFIYTWDWTRKLSRTWKAVRKGENTPGEWVKSWGTELRISREHVGLSEGSVKTLPGLKEDAYWNVIWNKVGSGKSQNIREWWCYQGTCRG